MNVFQELVKCQNDFFYFVENYVKIIHPIKGLITFNLMPYQKRYIEFIENNRFTCCVKFRQGGFTTLGVIHGLWECMFKSDRSILFLSKTDSEALCASDIVTSIMIYLPDWLLQPMIKNNDHIKHFSWTNSRIQFYSPNAARGKSATRLIIDEAAFICDMDKHWKAIWPVISNGGHCNVVSSTNGVGNWFSDIVFDAKQNNNKFQLFECSYTEHSEYYKPEVIEQLKQQLGDRGFRQEVLCEFLGSKSDDIGNVAELPNDELIHHLNLMVKGRLSTSQKLILAEVQKRLQAFTT